MTFDKKITQNNFKTISIQCVTKLKRSEQGADYRILKSTLEYSRVL